MRNLQVSVCLEAQAEREIAVLQRDSSIRCCLKTPFLAHVKQTLRDLEEEKKAPLRALQCIFLDMGLFVYIHGYMCKYKYIYI